MKYNNLLLLGLLSVALLFIGCKEDLQPNTRTETLFISAEGQGTKATIAEDGTFAWSNDYNDNFAIQTNRGFTLVDGCDGNQIEITLEEGEEREGYALFPYWHFFFGIDSPKYENESIIVNLGSTYALYTPSSSSSTSLKPTVPPGPPIPTYENESRLPMAAVNDPSTNQLQFKHVCGLLRLVLKDIPEGYGQIEVAFSGRKVCGDFPLNTTNPNYPYIASADYDGNSSDNSLTIITTLRDYDSAPAISEGYVNIPLPVGTYSSISISASGGWYSPVKAIVRTRTLNRTIERAHGLKLTVSFDEAKSNDLAWSEGSEW